MASSEPSPGIMSDPQRILILRLSAVGDHLLASPLIACLRAAYPHARIDWLSEPLSAPLMQAHPEIERVWIWPRGEWSALLREGRWIEWSRRVRAFRRELRSVGYDWALDVQGLAKSGVWAWISGARRRVGLGSKEGSRWLMSEVVHRRHDHPLFGGEYHDLARHLRLPLEPFRPALHLPAEAHVRAAAAIDEAGLADGFVALVPFTTRPQKHWFEARWTELGNRCVETWKLPVVLLGGPADGVAASRILEGARRHDADPKEEAAGEAAAPEARWVDRTGRQCLSLVDAAAWIARARLTIGVDTGMTHMATALGRPALALFGSTIPYRDPLSPRTQVLFDDSLPCLPCRKHPTCHGAFDCMRLLSVDRVFEAAGRLLAEEPPRARPAR